MKIERIAVWRVALPYVGGRYVWAKGVVEVADSTVVRIDTGTGPSGWGECCPVGTNYLPAYAAGVRCGIGVLAPQLLGLDPTRIGAINDVMDFALEGHPYAKSALDIACYDILGKAAGLPVHTLLGGRRSDAMPLYRAVPGGDSEQLAEAIAAFRGQGYFQFQLKVGGEPALDIERIAAVSALIEPGEVLFCDANQGWRKDAAARVVAATSGLGYVLEQPCASYQDCLSIRRRSPLRLKLDESLLSFEHLVRAHRDDALDSASIKLSRFGGLSASRLARDYCVAGRIPMSVEDAWGGEIATSAFAHLAASTPAALLENTTDLHRYNALSLGPSQLSTADGYMRIGDAPGLGVEPDLSLLGEPEAVYE